MLFTKNADTPIYRNGASSTKWSDNIFQTKRGRLQENFAFYSKLLQYSDRWEEKELPWMKAIWSLLKLSYFKNWRRFRQQLIFYFGFKSNFSISSKFIIELRHEIGITKISFQLTNCNQLIDSQRNNSMKENQLFSKALNEVHPKSNWKMWIKTEWGQLGG